MRDPSLQASIQMIVEASRMPADDATRCLFDRYRTASFDSRDAFVLALIGEVVTTRRLRQHVSGTLAPAEETT